MPEITGVDRFTVPLGGQDIELQSTDPLVRDVKFAPGSALQYTVDLNMITRVFSEMEMINGEFRPISPTPY